MSTKIAGRPSQQPRAERASKRGTKIAPAAKARLLAQAAAVPRTLEAKGPPRAGRSLDVDPAAARLELITTRPTSVQQAFKFANAFLDARQQQEHGPPLSSKEETWWLHLLNKVRGYDALASFQTRAECFKDERTHARLKELRELMTQIRGLDRDTGDYERSLLPASCAFNFPDRMTSVIDALDRSLQKPVSPKEPPVHRVLSAKEVDRVLGLDSGPFVGGPGVWIGQSHGGHNPGIGNDFRPSADGTSMIAVPSGRTR